MPTGRQNARNLTYVMVEEFSLTVAEAAERLGVSESTVRSDVKARRLRGLDRGPGRRPRWSVSRLHVDELLAEGGRRDRRSEPAARLGPAQEHGDAGSEAVQAELADARRELDQARGRIAVLESEVARLKTVARNANVAVQAQTDSLQQFVLETQPVER